MGGVEQFFDKCCSWNSTNVSQCTYYNISFRQPRFLKLFFFKLIFIIVDLQCCIIFLLYNRVNLLYIHIYPLFFRFYSHIGHYRVLSRVPCAICSIIAIVLVISYIYSTVYMSIPVSQFIIPLQPCPGSLSFPGSSGGKESAQNTGDLSLTSGFERPPGGGHGNPLQYACLENPHRQRCLVGYSPWGRKESDMAK